MVIKVITVLLLLQITIIKGDTVDRVTCQVTVLTFFQPGAQTHENVYVSKGRVNNLNLSCLGDFIGMFPTINK